jgi:hypothetical protein
MYFYMNLVRTSHKKFSFFCFLDFVASMCSAVLFVTCFPWCGWEAPTMGFEWEYGTWYETLVLDSMYHKNRDGIKGGFEGYPHSVPRPYSAALGPVPCPPTTLFTKFYTSNHFRPIFCAAGCEFRDDNITKPIHDTKHRSDWQTS